MDPFFGNLWDRFPQRRPHRSPYSSHPYAEANVTPTKPVYDYWGAPKVKPRTFTVPVHGPPNHHPSPNSSSVTNGTSPSKNNPKKVVTVPIDSDTPKSSSGIKKAAAPRMDETSAATIMQSAFRGFSARKGAPLKNLRVIRDVKAKAEDIGRRLADRQVVESILQNEKERLRINEEIMSLLLKLDAIQGVNSFVRESRKAVIRELVNLQEMIDFIITGKTIEGTCSMGAGAAEEDKHGEEMAASAKENGDAQSLERSPNEEEMDASAEVNGDAQFLERSPNEEEVRDEEFIEEGPNEERIRGEEVLGGVKLASGNDSETQEEVYILSDKIEKNNMQTEKPNHTEDISTGTGSNGGESTVVVESGEPGDLKENKPHDEELMKDSIDEEKCTYGNSNCEGHTGEELKGLESYIIPCTDVDVIRHSMDEDKCAESASDCELQTCSRLKDLDLSQADAETIQADKQHIEDDGMECEDNGKVLEAGASENGIVEEDIVNVKNENQRLKKAVADLFRQTELQNKLINNLSLRIAQLEEQMSKSKKKKCGDKKKKTKETSNITTRRQNTE